MHGSATKDYPAIIRGALTQQMGLHLARGHGAQEGRWSPDEHLTSGF